MSEAKVFELVEEDTSLDTNSIGKYSSPSLSSLDSEETSQGGYDTRVLDFGEVPRRRFVRNHYDQSGERSSLISIPKNTRHPSEVQVGAADESMIDPEELIQNLRKRFGLEADVGLQSFKKDPRKSPELDSHTTVHNASPAKTFISPSRMEMQTLSYKSYQSSLNDQEEEVNGPAEPQKDFTPLSSNPPIRPISVASSNSPLSSMSPNTVQSILNMARDTVKRNLFPLQHDSRLSNAVDFEPTTSSTISIPISAPRNASSSTFISTKQTQKPQPPLSSHVSNFKQTQPQKSNPTSVAVQTEPYYPPRQTSRTVGIQVKARRSLITNESATQTSLQPRSNMSTQTSGIAASFEVKQNSSTRTENGTNTEPNSPLMSPINLFSERPSNGMEDDEDPVLSWLISRLRSLQAEKSVLDREINKIGYENT